ncbi:hypothetical protein ACJRO7_019229 [Eucalyptus globulus]|uniref:Protein kinase domain-containing protein n=1 Tax=Eucalyptus globulus TaxID=34317 RepID=A0ABD3KCC1_EUCGL
MEDWDLWLSPPKRMLRHTIDSGPYRFLSCSSKNDKAGVLQEPEKGVEANFADYDKRTALHLASCEGCTEVVVLLLERGADANSIDRWGRTPLSDACSFGHEDICKILMARGGKDPECYLPDHNLAEWIVYNVYLSSYCFKQVGLDAQNPCYEIDCNEIDMEGAILIGEGVFGEVYMVKWRGTEVSSKNNTSDFMKELALWQKLRHPNIVQFLGVLKQSDRLIFLTEYLRNGSLFDILRKRGRLDPQTAVAYALDIARGMNYLHQHKPHAIIHRDLTPSACWSVDVQIKEPMLFMKEMLGKECTLSGRARLKSPDRLTQRIFLVSVNLFACACYSWKQDLYCTPLFSS